MAGRSEARTLMVFIDGLPFSWWARCGFGRDDNHVGRLVPTIGYSVNVKAALFAGLTPDAWGILNEFSPTFEENEVPSSNLWWLPYGADRAVHRALGRLLRRGVGNIPFGAIRDFRKVGLNAYEYGFDHATVLDVGRFERVMYSEVGHGRVLSGMAEGAAGNANVFVAIGYLDNLLHTHGIDGREPREYAERCADAINQASRHFDRTIVVSDHGHAEVDKGVDTRDLWRPLGRLGRLFIDSTIARFWFGGRANHFTRWRSLLDAFAQTAPGTYLSTPVRQIEGVSSRRFGHELFLLDEGLVFDPSFFGAGIPKSMHGYWPGLPSQKGVFARSDREVPAEVPVLDAFKFISDLVVSDGA